MAPKGGSGARQQSEEDLLLQDFSRNLSAKSSALFFGNAFIVSAIPICECPRGEPASGALLGPPSLRGRAGSPRSLSVLRARLPPLPLRPRGPGGGSRLEAASVVATWHVSGGIAAEWRGLSSGRIAATSCAGAPGQRQAPEPIFQRWQPAASCPLPWRRET